MYILSAKYVILINGGNNKKQFREARQQKIKFQRQKGIKKHVWRNLK